MKFAKILLAIVGVGLIAFGAKLALKPKEFLYAGTLEATRVDISTQVPSTISMVKVHEGDHVDEHQSLIALSCEDFHIAARLANQNYSRAQKLYQSGTLSQDGLDQIKNRKEEADLRIKWCNIDSPIQGTVLNRYHEPGEWVGPGVKLLTLANIREIWTYVYIPEPEVAALKVGMKVSGTVPEIPERIFQGTILKINSEAEFTPKNVQTQSERTRLVYGIKVSFLESNQDEVLKPGMTIEVKL